MVSLLVGYVFSLSLQSVSYIRNRVCLFDQGEFNAYSDNSFFFISDLITPLMKLVTCMNSNRKHSKFIKKKKKKIITLKKIFTQSKMLSIEVFSHNYKIH